MLPLLRGWSHSSKSRERVLDLVKIKRNFVTLAHLRILCAGCDQTADD